MNKYILMTSEELLELFQRALKNHSPQNNSASIPELSIQFNRKETSKHLNVSLSTLDRYAKDGIINPTKIGSRVTYSSIEIQRAIKYFTNNEDA